MKKTILVVLLSVFLLSAMTVPAMAQDMTVGVSVDDWFKYEVKVTQWISDDPFLPEGYFGPLSLADNETTSIVYTVTDITPYDGYSNVTFTITYNWKNGSVTEGTYEEMVSTASTGIFMIGADMEEGDLVSDAFLFFNMWDYPARSINETIDSEYLDSTRETNVCEYTIDLGGTPYDYVMHWDKATGIRVYYENHGDVPAIFTAAYEYTVVWQLVDSSVEGLVIPDLTGPIMLLTLIAVTIPIVLHKRKH